MKIILLFFAMNLFATDLFAAVVIETQAKFDTAYSRPIKINECFGLLPSSREYGIFLNIDCRAEEGESKHSSLFYRLNSGVVKEGKELYTTIDGSRILLAEKKWYGWRPADGVTIHYSAEQGSYLKYKVWVEVK